MAENEKKMPVFGAVYQEELWLILKDRCKNATFYNKDEYNADIGKRRALDQEHDKYSQIYDGYIN